RKLARGVGPRLPTLVNSLTVVPSGAIRLASRSGSLGYRIRSLRVAPWITKLSPMSMVDVIVLLDGMGSVAVTAGGAGYTFWTTLPLLGSVPLSTSTPALRF